MRTSIDTANSTTEDATLTAAARAGDTGAYGQLFERYHTRIYNYAYGITGNPEDAGDVAQETFVRVFEALPRLTGELKFSAYAYRTAHNLALNTVRHRDRFTVPDALDLVSDAAVRADPERVALVREQQQQAWSAALTLTDNHRAILCLRELHDLSYDEIAQVMEMPRNTVGVLLSRARLKYKEAFRMSSLDTDHLVKACRETLPLLSAYIDNELDDAKRRRVEDHLAECAFCRLALEEMTEASKSCRVIVPLIPPAAAKAAAWHRVEDLLGADRAQIRPGAGTGTLPGTQSAADPRPAGGGGEDDPRPRSPSRHPPRWLFAAGLAVAFIAAGVGLAVWAPFLHGRHDLDDTGAAVTTQVAAPTTGAMFAASGTSTTSLLIPEAAHTSPSSVTVGGTSTTRARGTTSTLAAVTTTSKTTTTPDSTTSTTVGGNAGPTTTPPTATSTTTTKVVDTQAPATPGQLAPASGTVAMKGEVTLRWSAVKDPSGVTYVIEIQGGDGKTYSPLTSAKTAGTSLTHLLEAPFERWRVKAIDGAGNASAPTEWWSVRLP